jgi:hypothetical protein
MPGQCCGGITEGAAGSRCDRQVARHIPACKWRWTISKGYRRSPVKYDIDYLKIDRSFVRDMTEANDDQICAKRSSLWRTSSA